MSRRKAATRGGRRKNEPVPVSREDDADENEIAFRHANTFDDDDDDGGAALPSNDADEDLSENENFRTATKARNGTVDDEDEMLETLFARRKLQQLKKKRAAADVEGGDEEEEEEGDDDDDDDANGDDDEDGYQNISDMLQDDDELSETTKQMAKRARRAFNHLDDDDHNDQADNDDNDLLFSSDDDDDVAAAADADERLRSLVYNLAGSKSRRKRSEAAEVATVEGAFNVPTGASANNAVSLDELLESLRDTTGLGSVKQQLGAIVNKERTGRAAVVHMLPQIEVERIQRRAAYEIVSGDVSKWTATVKRNREAEHVSFVKPAVVDGSSAALVSKFEPTTDLENEMHQVLRQAGATEDDVRKFEELELNKLTLEQAQKRQGELARMRTLLMRQEEKARRHAKIKSKSFRRSVRRDKAREAEKQAAAEPSSFEAAVERQKKLEFERAHLRATQKHTKGTKWLQQQMKNHGTSMEGTKEAIAEAQRNAERLKSFINDGRQTEGDDGSDAGGENDDVGEYGTGDDGADDEPTTGLMAMKFMKRGIERAAEENAEAAERATRDDYDNLERGAGADDGGDEARHGRRSFGGANGGDVSAAPGDGVLTGSRKIVDGGALVGKAALSASHKARAHDVMTIDFSDIAGAASAATESVVLPPQSVSTVNPWLDSTRASTTAAASRRQVTTNRERKALDRGRVSDGASIREREARSARAAEEAGGGNELVIDLANTLLTSSSAAATAAAAAAPVPRARDSARAAEADDVRDSSQALAGFDLASASDAQQALINRAFATGADDEEFHDAKKALIDSKLPPVPETLDSQAPGWGAWTGAGVVAKPMSSFKKRKLDALRAQVEKERADALKKRRDAKLPDVVISEQRDKKVAPVQLSQLPFGFETEAQLRALTAAPLGADWNSHRQHSRLVHAPVTTRPGQLIEPMKPTPAMEKRANDILKKRSLGRSARNKQQ